MTLHAQLEQDHRASEGSRVLRISQWRLKSLLRISQWTGMWWWMLESHVKGLKTQ